MKLLNSLFLLSAISTTSHAAVVYADFNDNTLGALSSFTAGAGQGGGTGFLAGDVWANTGLISVISGDLSAPAGTNYAITQGSAVGAHKVQNQTTTVRQTTRAVATTMGTSSGIWFSFLLNQPTTNSRGGITFNQLASQAMPGDPRIVATGTDLRVGLAVLQTTGTTISLGVDTLIVGLLEINPSGNESISLWVNPDVSGGIAGLGAPDNSLTEQAASLDAGVTRVGIQSYASDSQGGIFDAFILSDNSDANQAFADVTGVLIPEPTSGTLALLGGLLILRRRR